MFGDSSQPDSPSTVGTLFGCIVRRAAPAFPLLFILFVGCSEEDPHTGLLTQKVTRGSLVVTVAEQGLLESAENHEVKSKVRGRNTVLWIIESGSIVRKGDELVRLSSLGIEEQIDERRKYANWSQSAADRTAGSLASAKLAIGEYEEGRYPTELMTLQKEEAVAQSAIQNMVNQATHISQLADSQYTSDLELEEILFSVRDATRSLELIQTQIDVLTNYTFREEMQTLKGNLAGIEATHKANVERAQADLSRLERAEEELAGCVIVAERDGLVIHPNAAKWETAPIAEGSQVHKDQILLLMPDLQQMQVRVGVHESVVKRVTPDQSAVVTMATQQLSGKVTEVASITKPAGWWTGNQVRYDTVIQLPSEPGLQPGMSAEVEITVAEYEDVLLIPVAACVEQDKQAWCWVKQDGQPTRRSLVLGDTNDVHCIVEQGLQPGDEVYLNPAAFDSPVQQANSDDTGDTPEEDKAALQSAEPGDASEQSTKSGDKQ